MAIKYEARKCLMPDGSVVFNPSSRVIGNLRTEDVARSIAHATSLTEGDVENVITSLVREVSDALKLGCSVTLDGLGTFSAHLRKKKGAKGSPSAEAVTLENIDGAIVRFQSAAKLKKAMKDAEIEKWDNKGNL